MHVMMFSERPHSYIPEDDIIKNGMSYFGVPNSLFDAQKSSRLLNEYLDEMVYGEELGFDGIMLNEHHQTAFCGGSVMDVGLVESLDPLMAPLRHGLTAPGGTLGGGAPQYGVYETKLGRIAVAALEPHFERELYRHLELPVHSDPSSGFLERTAAEWERWARERGLPIVEVR